LNHLGDFFAKDETGEIASSNYEAIFRCPWEGRSHFTVGKKSYDVFKWKLRKNKKNMFGQTRA